MKLPDGRSTRGGTPGKYVLRYMCREGATEDLTPVKLDDTEDFSMRYHRRRQASERGNSVRDVKRRMRKAQGLGGVAFCNGDVSMSHDKVVAASQDIQAAFDSGKTVMKTVLSFDLDYLRENGVVDRDFEVRKDGDYRGNIDQMRLRMAVMNGLGRLSRHYDDLRYIGCFQIDTKHVHCHLAMYDAGVGRMHDDRQNGQLYDVHKQDIRRGIDMFLDENQMVRRMSSNFNHDRRNAVCFIKKFTHRAMEQNGFSQFVLSCLPEDKAMWRANSNAKEMRKANYVVREYVTELLRRPDSGYREALGKVDGYARARQRREGLSDTDYRRLYRNGQERIVSTCMDGVYSVLKQVPDEDRVVRTPMLDVMSQDYDLVSSMADSDPMIEFGFKLRSYSSRLQYHKKEKAKYREARKSYESATDASPDSRPVYEFFKSEEEYNDKLMCKYQHFLSFLPPGDEYEDEFDDLMRHRRRISNLKKMRDDKLIERMSPDAADDYGRRVYGCDDGRLVRSAPFVIDRRLENMEADYLEKEDAFRDKLTDYGLTLESGDDGMRVSNRKKYEFDDVKALDVHHLGYDFAQDTLVSKVNVDRFIEAANRRYEVFDAAREYLVSSGQGDSVSMLPESDIRHMKDVADHLAKTNVIPAVRPDDGTQKDTRTIRLSDDYEQDITLAIRSTLATIEFE